MRNRLFLTSMILLALTFTGCKEEKHPTQPEKPTLPPTELRTVFLDGYEFNYLDIGSGEPVVFVHGAFGDYRTWKEQIDTFAQHYRVISYSKRLYYPNNQVVDDSTDVSGTAHARDLGELLKALNLKNVHLVGHSGGGHVALLTTMENPELIQSLVLGEPVVPSLLQNVSGGDTLLNSLYTNVLQPASEAFRNKEDEKAVEAFINGVIGDSLYFANLPERDQENFMANLSEVKQNLLYGGPPEQLTCNDLTNIDVPILLLYGSQSIPFFTSMNNELYRCLNNIEKAIIKDAGHGLELQNPEEFNRIVLEFIRKQ